VLALYKNGYITADLHISKQRQMEEEHYLIEDEKIIDSVYL